MAEQNTTDKLTLAKFEEAYDIVHKVVLPTKLIYSDYFSGITRYTSNLRTFRRPVHTRSGVHITR